MKTNKNVKEFKVEEVLKDGTKVIIRLLKFLDKNKLLEMYQSLSSKSKKDFFKGYRTFSSWRSIRVGASRIYVDGLDIDYNRKVSLVAIIKRKDKEKIIGDGRYYLTEEGYAEISLIVDDEYQNKGLGQLLLKNMIKLMKANKVKGAYGIISKDQEMVKHILKKFGFKEVKAYDGEILLRLDLI
ncbi:MAG: GNAT family N-acetyltransferase [Candidatus Odinarchaeia archaeon]